MSSHEIAYTVIIGIYLVAVLGLAVWIAKRLIGDEHDFMIAGREIGATLHGASLIAIQLSGGFVPAIVLWGYISGVGGVWFFWGWSIGHLLVLLTWAGFWRYTGGYTPAEYFEFQYGRSGRLAVLTATLVFGLFAGAFQYLGAGGLIAGALDLPTWIAIVVVGTVITLYALLAGFWGITITDFIQAAWVISAVFILVPLYLFINHGLPTTEAGVPPDLLSIPFGTIDVLGFASGTVITFIILNFFLANSAHYWMRASSTRNKRALKQGYMIAIGLNIILGVIGVMIGLWAQMLVSPQTPEQAFGLLLAEETPILLGALAISGVIAATMSTVDMMYQMMANTITRDMLQRFVGITDHGSLLRYSRLTIVGAGAITISFAVLWPEGLPSLISFAFATAGPLAILSLDAWYVRYGTKEGAVIMIGGVWIAIFVWEFVLPTPEVDVLWVSGVVSLVLFYAASALARTTGPWWGTEEGANRIVNRSTGGD